MKNYKKYIPGFLLISPVLLGCLVFYVIPFLEVLGSSFKSAPGDIGSFVGLGNYKDLFANELFRLAAVNTLRFFLLALPLNLMVAYVIALLLKEKAKKYHLIKSVLMFPYIMPVTGTMFLIEQIFGNDGHLNVLFSWLGLSTIDFMESSYTSIIMVLLYLWKSTGYSVILLLSGLMTISGDQYEAAEIDGAKGWQKYWYITVPQMWNSVFFTFIFAMINGFKCFREIFLIGGKHPGTQLYMLQHFINNSFENLSYSKLTASSVFLFLVITVVMGFTYILVQKKEAYK